MLAGGLQIPLACCGLDRDVFVSEVRNKMGAVASETIPGCTVTTGLLKSVPGPLVGCKQKKGCVVGQERSREFRRVFAASVRVLFPHYLR